MPLSADDPDIAAMRGFNRFYTRAIGLLGRYLDAPWSLTESRVFYELFAREGLTAAELCDELGLDAGYVSRILKKFEAAGWLARRPSADDARRAILTLTEAGRATFAPYDRASRDEMGAVLERLGATDRGRLVGAMGLIERLMTEGGEEVIVRRHKPGDMGAIIAGQARVYAAEFGWDATFEALVAQIGGEFLKAHDPARERAFIAERGGQVVGSVFCIDAGEGVAKLRMLYVDEAARGLGLGRRLVADCIAFARQTGYRRMVLWTNDILASARRIYQAEGFVLTAEDKHHSFGVDLVGQTWELDLIKS